MILNFSESCLDKKVQVLKIKRQKFRQIFVENPFFQKQNCQFLHKTKAWRRNFQLFRKSHTQKELFLGLNLRFVFKFSSFQNFQERKK